MARAHSRLAARSRPISASLMVSGTDTCKTPSPARHSIFPSRDAQGSAPGPGEDFGAGNCVCSKKKSKSRAGRRGRSRLLPRSAAPPGSGRRRGPSEGTSGAVPEAAAVEGTPWCATSVSTGCMGARGALPDPPGPALTGPARGDSGLP